MSDTPRPQEDEPADDLVAYLDGELPERDADAVENRLLRDPAIRREADALKRTWDLLDHLPRPEPSASFTSRTLDRLALPPAPGSVAVSVPVSAPPPRRRVPIVGWLVAGLAAMVAFFVGYGAADRAGRSRAIPDVERLSLAEVQMLEKLPLYRHADDAEFVEALRQPDLFGEGTPWR